MNSTHEPVPSAQIVLQRVRNAIIEHLELCSCFGAQEEYQSKVPLPVVPEIVNQWEDWAIDGWEASYVQPVFSDEERSAIARFGEIWSHVAESLPEPSPPLAEVQQTDAWMQLRAAAEGALRIFELRGKLPEHAEIGTSS